jgi:M6 family metalloprotease-like protein
MQKLGIMLLIIALAIPLQAALLQNIPTRVTQPDGQVLNLLATGDEYHNWLHDKDNYTIIQNRASGLYTYALKSGGQLYPSEYRVGSILPASAGITPGLNIDPEIYKQKRLARWQNVPRDGMRAPTSGVINNLVVYIRFAGETEFTGSLTSYDTMFNNTTPGTNSMYNYFKEDSYNALEISTSFYPTPNNNVIVSFQDSHPRNYYEPYSGSNPTGYTDDDDRTDREHTLLRNALLFVTPQIPATLDVDADDDGEVDNVCFVVKGATGAWADLLWPHMWDLYSYDVYLNGAVVGPFNFQLEDSLLDSGVGVLCHEMSHSMGFPDLYHYSYDGFSTVGRWDLMESNQNPPQHHSAYMKYRYGNWIDTIPEITENGTYWINKMLNPEGNCYKIASNNPQYYFVVEFRKKTGTFENSIPGTGMLVYRVNTALSGVGNADGPPDELYLYRLNGTTTTNGQSSSAHFSTQVNRTAIGETTNPVAFLPDGNYGGLNIYAIGSSAGDSISFTIEFPATPPTSYDEGFETGDFTANPWTFGGNSNWTVTSAAPFMGTYCAKSGAIGHNQSSILQLTMDVPTAGEIGFYRTISSEAGYDYLKFYIDDVQQAQWSGTASWAYVHFPVNAGNHTFKWSYIKDQGVVSGSDCAWIDNISFLWEAPDTFLPPLDFTVSSMVQDVCAILEWNAPTVSPNAMLNGYRIYKNGAQITNLPAAQNVFYDYQVVPNFTYSYFVTALYTLPTGESSSTDTLEVLIDGAVAIPVLNITEIVDTNSVYISWSVNMPDRGITGYNIYRNGGLIQSISDAATFNYTDSDLPNGEYVYQTANIRLLPLISQILCL